VHAADDAAADRAEAAFLAACQVGETAPDRALILHRVSAA